MRPKKDKIARIKILTQSTKPRSLTVARVLKSIADPISAELFQSISAEGSERSDLIDIGKKSLSLRQYYSRISNLTRNGMLIKKNGKNYRTTFGKIVYHMLKTIENAFTDYYKLEAIDSIGLQHGIPQEEHKIHRQIDR